jgi:hypothetical protein
MPDNLDDLRSRLADVLGTRSYNRLVASARGVTQLPRFRYWQESLLRQAAEAGVEIATTDEFLAVFADATPLADCTEPNSQELFLSLLDEFPYGGFRFEKIPTQWMADAWENDRIREELSAEMARTVSELGELAYDAEYLAYLSRSLPPPRQAELFVYLRDACGSDTREDDFRPSFERAFPASVPHLPPSLSGHPDGGP